MKSLKGFRNVAVLTALILSGSCLDYTVTTRVNRDGSIFREYEVRGDSTDIFKGTLRVPSGPEWKISHEYTFKDKGDTTSEKSQYLYRASRTFKNITELQKWLATDTSRKTIKPLTTLKKRFRWFYTYFDYAETYPMEFPFQNVTIDSFLTDKEQSLFRKDEKAVYSPVEHRLVWQEDAPKFTYSHADSLEIKKISDHCDRQLQKWMVASILNEYTGIMQANFKDDPAVISLSKKEKAIASALENFNFLSKDSASEMWLAHTADSVIASNRLEQLRQDHPEVFKPMEDKFRALDNLSYEDSYTQDLILPGRVYYTNSDEFGKAGMSWKLDDNYFFLKDYTIKASSRVANVWIMVLTAFIVVFLVTVLFIRKRTDRSST
jgi:hypothetical protein